MVFYSARCMSVVVVCQMSAFKSQQRLLEIESVFPPNIYPWVPPIKLCRIDGPSSLPVKYRSHAVGSGHEVVLGAGRE